MTLENRMAVVLMVVPSSHVALNMRKRAAFTSITCGVVVSMRRWWELRVAGKR